jgi:hypothetical protein
VIDRQNKSLRGMEIFEVHPVILGGNPDDAANKIVLTRAEHIELVTYWNRTVRDLKKQQAEHR